ncbi:MAG: CRISPR-associated endonuclease Cas3'', partial [bacterium]
MADIEVFSLKNLEVLWAKSDPRHPLWKHLLDTAAVSLALANPLADFGWEKTHTAFLVGLHDIGKTDPAFQHQVKEFSGDLEKAGFKCTADAPVRHERLSGRFVREKLEQAGLDDSTARTIARVVAAHHGHWDEEARPAPFEYEQAKVGLWDLLGMVLAAFPLPTNVPSNMSAFGMRLVGHIVLCDWIASNEIFYTDPRLQEAAEPCLYFRQAQAVAGEW